MRRLPKGPRGVPIGVPLHDTAIDQTSKRRPGKTPAPKSGDRGGEGGLGRRRASLCSPAPPKKVPEHLDEGKLYRLELSRAVTQRGRLQRLRRSLDDPRRACALEHTHARAELLSRAPRLFSSLAPRRSCRPPVLGCGARFARGRRVVRNTAGEVEACWTRSRGGFGVLRTSGRPLPGRSVRRPTCWESCVAAWSGRPDVSSYLITFSSCCYTYYLCFDFVFVFFGPI